MKIYSENDNYELYHGNMLEMLDEIKPNSIDSIVTDPPYEINFMGRGWDNSGNGVGAINIDECKIGDDVIKGGTMPDLDYVGKEQKKNGNGHRLSFGQVENAPRVEREDNIGRFPANTIIDEEVALSMPMGSQTGKRSQKSINNCIESRKQKKGNSQCDIGGNIDHITEYNDSGSVSRYFYCAKASKKDRDEGLEGFEEKTKVFNGKSNTSSEDMKDVEKRFTTIAKNTHPTVKPTELMQYLVRLVTPDGGVILDPFNGSGSTGKAAMYENRERNKNYKYIGIELTEEYLPIAKARIEYVCRTPLEILKEQVEDIPEGQTSIFEFMDNSDE